MHATQALADPSRVDLHPDPASQSGRSIRVIGWCEGIGELLTIIVVEHDGVIFGVNGWVANSTDRNRYFTAGNSQ